MNKTRNIGIVVAGIGLILLILLIYFTFFRTRPIIEEPEIIEDPSLIDIGLPETDEPSISPGDRAIREGAYDISQESPRSPDIEDVSRLAMYFTERFGSFSSQSNFSNIVDSQLFMTKSLRDWSETYIKRLREENPADSYYGISTIALSTETIDYNEGLGKASIRVITQRRESQEGVEGENVFRQDLLVELEKENGDWKVKAIYWQDIN